MEKRITKREPWPTGLFDCCSGGRSLCLWGFLCPFCLDNQAWTYSNDLTTSSSSSSSSSSSPNQLTESQQERYPPWSCQGIVCSQFAAVLLFSCCCCLYGLLVGVQRHPQIASRGNFEYYCSSQSCCCSCCFDDVSVEDCLIGYFCCCCSVVQVTMANDELFRMQSKVEGDVNIKRAH